MRGLTCKNCGKDISSLTPTKPPRSYCGLACMRLYKANPTLEALAAQVHKIYCRQYEKEHGKPYWTKGDYSKLNERSKQYDRNIVRWHLRRVARLLAD